LSRRPRPAVFLLLALPVLGLLASACTGLASPKGYASPVLTDDGILLVSHREDVFAYEVDGMRPLWGFPSGDIDKDDIVALYGTPTVADGTVLIPTYDGKLFALSLEDGTPIWAEPFKADGPLVGGVAVANGTAFFGSSGGELYAVDVETGEEAWPAFQTDKEIWSTPVIVGDDLFVTSLDGHLYVLDPTTGQERWSFETDAGVAATPVVDGAGGRVIVGSFDQKLRAIDLETRDELWSASASNWFWAEPLLNAGVVYAPSLDSKVYAVTAATGEKEWEDPFDAKGEIKASPVMIGGTLFVVDRDGLVYGIDAQSGREAFPDPLDLGGSVLADPIALEQDGATVLAVVTTGGDLYLIDPETLQTLRQIELSG